jgi:hypothetical protein
MSANVDDPSDYRREASDPYGSMALVRAGNEVTCINSRWPRPPLRPGVKLCWLVSIIRTFYESLQAWRERSTAVLVRRDSTKTRAPAALAPMEGGREEHDKEKAPASRGHQGHQQEGNRMDPLRRPNLVQRFDFRVGKSAAPAPKADCAFDRPLDDPDPIIFRHRACIVEYS